MSEVTTVKPTPMRMPTLRRLKPTMITFTGLRATCVADFRSAAREWP
jgi:hypothetical protein